MAVLINNDLLFRKKRFTAKDTKNHQAKKQFLKREGREVARS